MGTPPLPCAACPNTVDGVGKPVLITVQQAVTQHQVRLGLSPEKEIFCSPLFLVSPVSAGPQSSEMEGEKKSTRTPSPAFSGCRISFWLTVVSKNRARSMALWQPEEEICFWLHATESQYALWGLSSVLIPVYSRELFTAYQAGGIPFSYTLLWLITRLQAHLLSIAHMKASRRWSIDFCWDLNY